MKKGLLIVLSGPSGVGKGTVRKCIFEKKCLDLTYSISMTTRLPRNKEVDGVDYYFVTQDFFKEKIKKGEFLEYAEFVGNFYGTPKDKIEELRNAGHNVFVEIEINGANQVFDQIQDDGLVSIFLMPPSIKDLENRIRRRKTESEETIRERLDKGQKEMTMTDRYQHIVLNDSVERVSQEIIRIIKDKLSRN